MSAEAPSAKRSRTEADGSSDEITKSKYWFDDGNVILQAENIQFRVHRSVLSNHSIVFRDMFTMPQPAPLDPVFDGCPIVPLSDKADDIRHLMSLFYENFKTHDMRELMSFPLLAAILRLGKKYQIEHLQAEGLRRLRNEFPNDLGLWDASLDKQVQLSEVSENCENIINLAHELSVQTILPVVYLHYLNIATMDEIIHGRELDSEDDPEQSSECAPRVLNEKAVQECLKGRERIIRQFIEIFKRWLTSSGIIPVASCVRGTACLAQKAQAIFDLPAMDFESISILHPLDATYASSFLCHNCMASLESSFNAAREEIWDELPTYFDLPDWEELQDFA